MNKELALRVLNKIEQNPDTWDQRIFANACGTKFCFAGHIVHEVYPDAKPNLCPGEDSTASFFLNGEVGYYSVVARKLLDIDIHQAHYLFAHSNSLKTIRRLIG